MEHGIVPALPIPPLVGAVPGCKRDWMEVRAAIEAEPPVSERKFICNAIGRGSFFHGRQMVGFIGTQLGTLRGFLLGATYGAWCARQSDELDVLWGSRSDPQVDKAWREQEKIGRLAWLDQIIAAAPEVAT